MCGRFVLAAEPDDIGEHFEVEAEDFPARHNIAPTQPILAILDEHGHRASRLMRWGLVPGWVKDPRDFPLLVNARAETMAGKPAFRDALNHGRCIVPASGYYEWQAGPDKRKQPYFISRADGRPMALAGLYTIWAGPNGEEVDTVATITVAANAQMAEIHDRMPAILDPGDFDAWLDVRGVTGAQALPLIRPLPEGVLKFHPVSSRVNSANTDDPDLIVPVRPEAPPRPRQMDLF
ncbi:MAG TPA: SOS response-associated peptidase [Devosia sp.]|nr:SOS response-associated peptidase [Devosia sp.]